MNEHFGTILLLNIRRAALGSSDEGSDYLGLFYLAAVLEERGYDPWVFHGGAHEVPQVIEQQAQRGPVAAVGFSCDFENRTAVEELSSFVKERYGLTIVVGGAQAIALGRNFFAASNCDYVVRGEAEESLPDLLDCVIRGSGKLEDIAGVTWLDPEGRLRAAPERAPVSNLDSLPLPAYHRSLHKGRIYGRNLFTGRGCPFSCAFCYQSRHKKRVRLRSLDRVFDELRRNLEAYPGLNYISVLDDTFTLDPKRVEAFCRQMDELRLERGVVWYCESHVHLLAKWPELIPMMARSGLARLQIGVETGNQEVLSLYGKQVTLPEIEKVVSEAVRAEVPQLATNFIIGGPLETHETVEASAAFAEHLLRLAPGVIDILTGFLRPYPGTAITEHPEAFGLAIEDEQAVRSFDDYPMVIPEGATTQEILEWRRMVTSRIRTTMHSLLREGKIAHETILSQYRNAFSYGIRSLWYSQVFKKDPFLDEYFRLVTKGAARRLQDVPREERMKWRPQRTIEMRKALDFEHGFPRIRGYVLSPLELELLLDCSGKLQIEEVIERLRPTFRGDDDDPGEFTTRITNLLRTFEDKYWVAFCRI